MDALHPAIRLAPLKAGRFAARLLAQPIPYEKLALCGASIRTLSCLVDESLCGRKGVDTCVLRWAMGCVV